MYYWVDENGNLVSSDTSDILPSEYQDLFPDQVPPQLGGVEDPTGSSNSVTIPGFTGSGNSASIPDINIVSPELNYKALADALTESDFFDSLADTLANVPSYTVFPNTSAVSVMQQVLNGVDGHFGYFVSAGATSSEVDMYYARDYTVSGKNITLHSPVTHCKYYSYRPSGTSGTVYTYTVSNLADTSVTLSNQLVYTNLVDGYPDLIPYKQRNNYDFIFLITIGILIVALSTFSSRFRARKEK